MTVFQIIPTLTFLLALTLDCNAVGANLTSELIWNARPDWVHNPADFHKVSSSPEVTRFEVKQPGRGMKWTAEISQPLDLAKTPWLLIRYRAIGADHPLGYFVYIHGTKGEEQFIAEPSDFISDGRWHTLVKQANPVMADMLAVQLQAARPNGTIEISRLEFHENAPKLTFAELLATDKQKAGKNFKPVDLRSIFNSSHKVLMEELNISEWSKENEIIVSGIPFRIYSGPKSLAMTYADKPTELHIPLNEVRASEIFLLIATASKNKDAVSLSPEPHLFSAKIVYSRAMADETIPARIPEGFGLAQGFGVYAITTSREHPIKELIIRENIPSVSLYLISATIGFDSNIAAHARPLKVGGAKAHIYSEAKRNYNWNAYVSPISERIEIFNGETRVVVRYRPGVSIEIRGEEGPPSISAKGSFWRVRMGDQILESTDFEGSVVESRGVFSTLELTDRKGLGINGLLSITPQSGDRIHFQLDLWTKEKSKIQVDFPTISEIKSLRGANLSYCFPRRGAVINDIPIELREPYSGLMPLQFMDVYGPDGGMYLITMDTLATYRYFHLRKDAKGISMSVEYLEQEVLPWARFTSPATTIGFHKGDWHSAFNAYKEWIGTWYKPDAPRKDWFRKVFNFRQQFLRFYIPGGEKYYNKEKKKYTFAEGIAEDSKAFGGVDYLHLFDWGASEKWGRCGDYDPWDEIGGVEAFRDAITKTQASGIPVGLYIEGYLVDPQSRIAQAHGKEWQIIGKDGKPLPFFAPALNMCSAVKEWQDYLASVYSTIKEKTHALGYYCDEMGFADPGHFCYAENHGHSVPEPPLRGQRDLLKKIRQALGPDVALYTEETPADVNTQHQDGSFTYAISSVSDAWSPSHINLTRFALLDFKTFEIIVCDKPLGDRLTAVRQIFFNGEGIWLEGPADKWFAPQVLAFIRKMHKVMRKYEDCFTSLSPVPLVPTGQKLVFANKFPAKERTLWTLFNANYSTVRGELLAVEHTPGAKYYDVWNGRELKPRIVGEIAYLTLEIGPRDVGCVVKELKVDRSTKAKN
ncbi:MAG: DUF6259 domain-containing protein [Armatimonadetes bacterium]|nr:DUF6259 domain-containing protein [Armatimonadota bacterium]